MVPRRWSGGEERGGEGEGKRVATDAYIVGDWKERKARGREEKKEIWREEGTSQ